MTAAIVLVFFRHLKGSAYMGMTVNVVLPFLHAVAVKEGHPGAGEAYLGLYRRFPKLQENELTREMAHQLLAPAWRPEVKGACRQQGLLHLHQLLSGFP